MTLEQKICGFQFNGPECYFESYAEKEHALTVLKDAFAEGRLRAPVLFSRWDRNQKIGCAMYVMECENIHIRKLPWEITTVNDNCPHTDAGVITDAEALFEYIRGIPVGHPVGG